MYKLKYPYFHYHISQNSNNQVHTLLKIILFSFYRNSNITRIKIKFTFKPRLSLFIDRTSKLKCQDWALHAMLLTKIKMIKLSCYLWTGSPTMPITTSAFPILKVMRSFVVSNYEFPTNTLGHDLGCIMTVFTYLKVLNYPGWRPKVLMDP